MSEYSKDICPSCKKEYKTLGIHWRRGSCEWPKPSKKQRSIIRGLMLGDATLINRFDSRKTPRITAYSIKKPFLEYIKKELEYLANEVKLYQSAKDSARCARKNGLDGSAKEENYSNCYKLALRSNPFYKKYKSWYSEGKKKINFKDINLDKTAVKIWYCGDGGLCWKDGDSYPCAKICHKHGKNRLKAASRFFKNLGLESYVDSDGIRFNSKSTEKFIEWLGDAPPGFEYKFSLDNKKSYGDIRNTGFEDRSELDIEDLKKDIVRCDNLCKNSISLNFYSKEGKYSISSIYKYFDSWNKVKDELGLEKSKVKNQYN